MNLFGFFNSIFYVECCQENCCKIRCFSKDCFIVDCEENKDMISIDEEWEKILREEIHNLNEELTATESDEDINISI